MLSVLLTHCILGASLVRSTNYVLNKYLLTGEWKEAANALKFINPCPINEEYWIIKAQPN